MGFPLLMAADGFSPRPADGYSSVVGFSPVDGFSSVDGFDGEHLYHHIWGKYVVISLRR